MKQGHSITLMPLANSTKSTSIYGKSGVGAEAEELAQRRSPESCASTDGVVSRHVDTSVAHL